MNAWNLLLMAEPTQAVPTIHRWISVVATASGMLIVAPTSTGSWIYADTYGNAWIQSYMNVGQTYCLTFPPAEAHAIREVGHRLKLVPELSK